MFELQSTDLVIRNLQTFAGISEGKTPGDPNDIVNGEMKNGGDKQDNESENKTEGGKPYLHSFVNMY